MQGSHSDIDAKQSDVLKGDAQVSPCLEKPEDDKEKEAQQNHLLKEETEDVSRLCLEISRDVENDGAQGDHSGFAATENHPLVGEIEEVLQPCLGKAEDDKQKKAVDHSLPNDDGLGSEAEQDQGSVELDKNVK